MAREVNGSDAVDQAEDVPMEGAGWLSMQNLTTLRKGATQDLSRLASVLSSKAQSLVSTSPVLKEVPGNSQVDVASTSSTLRRQEEFNRISLSLTGVNYMMNMAGRQANDSLRREVEDGRAKIDLLHESVQDQSIVIDTLNDSLSELRVHASQQEREAERLRRDLRERSRSLTSSLEQLRRQAMSQQYVITSQQSALESMRQRKLKQDGIVDMVASAISLFLYGVNLSLVDGPLRMALLVIPRKRLRTWVRQLSKTLAWLMIMRSFRSFALRSGLHTGMGQLQPYLSAVTSYVTGQLRRRLQDDTPGVPSPIPANQPSSLSTPASPLRGAESSIAASFVGEDAHVGLATPGKWSEG